MSRSRPASNPVSFHKHTKQYYITRGGRRIYLGSEKEKALKKYHCLGLGFEPIQQEPTPLPLEITTKDLANRFIAAQ
jgi:hypothetical protein